MSGPYDPKPTITLPSLSRRRWLELGVLSALLGLALAAAGFLGSVRDGVPRHAARAFDVVRMTAEPARAFELTDLGGRPVRLEDFRGRVVLLNFWATWCVPCREEFPAMAALARELGHRGLVVVAVNHEEARDSVEAFAREFGVAFPVLLDPAGEVARQYRLQALPTTYFVDRAGMLAGMALGYRKWDTPEARVYLRELLDGARVSAAR